MAFPVNGVLDAFGSSSTPPTGWTNSISTANGGLATDGSGVVKPATAGDGTSNGWWNAGTFGPDCESYCTVSTKPADGSPTFVYARIASPGTASPNGYLLRVTAAAGTDTWEICRIDSGTITVLGAAGSQEIASGDKMGLEIVGSTLTAYYKAVAGSWGSLFSRTDSTYSSAGYIGLGLWFYATGRADDFGGGALDSTGVQKTGMGVIGQV